MSSDGLALSRRVREIETMWIPLADGTRLAARAWLPDDAHGVPVPAIFEYLPYRQRDGTSGRDARMHPYIARHGYACVRVDIRGSGDSDGVLLDEYAKQEQDDCLEVIGWLTRQPWCSGAVGMIGNSWGGFNALQVAARRPPALQAIVTVCSTDDRYAGDVHFMGGALLRENLTWGSTMFSHQTRPPDPAVVGERWRAMWMERLEKIPFFPADWLEHQRRDALWQHGSVCEDWDAIQCPVYAVGGWTDAYRDAVPRLLANLKVPRKGLIGPWAHGYPQSGMPGPAIGFLQETLRWWDKWLKGIETGIMDEPMLLAWMQESVRPAPWHAERPGRWVAETAWPGPSISPRHLFMTTHGLADIAGAATPIAFASPESLGVCSGAWCPYGAAPDDAPDQREDDVKSLLFDSTPLPKRIEILGTPVIEVELAADRPNAKLVVRLCDVHPDGASTRVSYGVLNLAHRDSDLHPQALRPGETYRVRLQLNSISYAFPPSHRIRVALSTTYFPLTWPSPERATLTLTTGPAMLILPVRPPNAADGLAKPFALPAMSPPERRTPVRAPARQRTVTRDAMTGETIYTTLDDDGRTRIEAIDLEVGSSRFHEYRIRDDDPLSCRMEARATKEMGRGDFQIRTATRVVMTATATEFLMRAEMDAWEDDKRVCARNFDRTIPRDLV